MADELEARLSQLEETLAHQDLALEDLSTVFNAYRQDLDGLKRQVTTLEQRFAALLDALADRQSDHGS